jgi:hypothetical protein
MSEMRGFAVFLIVALVAVLGCAPHAPALTIILATPEPGSSVPSLSPVLSWSSSGNATSYQLQVATDSNFQNLIVDTDNLTDNVYTVSAGKLDYDQTYHWRVEARGEGQASSWSSTWYFRTPTRVEGDTIHVGVTLNGAPWSGSVNCTITGPTTFSISSAPQSFTKSPPGTYTVTHNFGGPSGATLASITPSATQNLSAGGSVSFTLDFYNQSTSGITVKATLDGSAWGGAVSYSLSGPSANSGGSVPRSFSSLSAGTYTLTYNAGGPDGATFASITPSPTQTLSAGSGIIYTLNFYKSSAGQVLVKATINGVSWSGTINYTITGPYVDSNSSVPYSFTNSPAGDYEFTYNFGGPSGATLTEISPSVKQTLAKGDTIVFTLDFAQDVGSIRVNATLDGAPWPTAGSGTVSYSIVGPMTQSSNAVPDSFGNMPTGAYTLNYLSGGPPGAVLASITPSPTCTLAADGTLVFTLNFEGQP